MPKTRYVAHLCGSVRNLVSREMIQRGLWVTNWGNIHAKPVAECALLLTLCTLRKTTRWTLAMHRDKLWPHEALHQSCTLLGRRIGLHGFGGVARELIQFLKPFGCPISAYSTGVPDEFIRQHGATPAGSLKELFAQSDVLIEVEALTPQTRHSVTDELLRLLPVGASFVNVGRGAVVDEAALIQVAREGRLEIGLDVFEAEPVPTDSPLRGLPNVTLSPHIGGPTADMRRGCGARAVNNLLRFARGEKPEGLITPELYDRST
jgi:phosphoglycerate dehydrogenase-like enzyme